MVTYLLRGSVRASVIPSVTVPVSLIATFILLWVFGFAINLLTLLALVLAIGLVVDDAIVVLENIYRRIEMGEAALDRRRAGRHLGGQRLSLPPGALGVCSQRESRRLFCHRQRPGRRFFRIYAGIFE